uniref:Uncharacterized protein n=1 Tax=Solanum tuberosum TaxID=4113 RepID=M1BCU8_SOLTU
MLKEDDRISYEINGDKQEGLSLGLLVRCNSRATGLAPNNAMVQPSWKVQCSP